MIVLQFGLLSRLFDLYYRCFWPPHFGWNSRLDYTYYEGSRRVTAKRSNVIIVRRTSIWSLIFSTEWLWR